jgi:predicted transcriptional regulator
MAALENSVHEINELDREIMSTVRKIRGLWTPRKLADTLKKSQSTLEKRVTLLRESRLLEDVTNVQVTALGYVLRYRIDVSADQ